MSSLFEKLLLRKPQRARLSGNSAVSLKVYPDRLNIVQGEGDKEYLFQDIEKITVQTYYSELSIPENITIILKQEHRAINIHLPNTQKTDKLLDAYSDYLLTSEFPKNLSTLDIDLGGRDTPIRLAHGVILVGDNETPHGDEDPRVCEVPFNDIGEFLKINDEDYTFSIISLDRECSITPDIAQNIVSTKKIMETILRNQRSKSTPIWKNVLPTWLTSFLIAGMVLLMVIVMMGFTATSFAPTFESLKEAWLILYQPSSNPWSAMPFLLALFGVPITLFIPTVITGNEPNSTEKQRQARKIVRSVMAHTSLIVAILSWWFWPLLFHGFTAVLSVVLVPGISLVCSILTNFSAPDRNLAVALDQDRKELVRLKEVEKTARKDAAKFLTGTELRHTSELSLNSKTHKRWGWTILIISAIICVVIWLICGITRFPSVRGLSAILLSSIPISAEMILAYALVRIRTSDGLNPYLLIFTILFNPFVILVGISLLSAQSQPLSYRWWAFAGLTILPCVVFIVVLLFSRHWRLYYWWRRSMKQVDECQQNLYDTYRGYIFEIDPQQERDVRAIPSK